MVNTPGKLLIATGNANKFYEATQIFDSLNIPVTQAKIDVDEIQHKDHVAITEAKARSAYDVVKAPVVVNDSFWDIPALGGFPGAYMKDVADWLMADDFLNLMRDKEDKRIILHECTAFYDGETLKTFVHDRPGHFVPEPKGSSPPSFVKVIEIEGDGKTISEVFDDGNWEVTPQKHAHWYKVAEWYATQYVRQNSVR